MNLFFEGEKLIFRMLVLLTLLVILWQVSLKLEANLPLVVLIPAANFLRALFMSIQFYSPLSNTALCTSVRGCASRGIKYCTLALPPQNTAEAKEWEIELPVLYFC